MSDYIAAMQQTGYERQRAERLAKQLKTETTLTGGVLRWNMGNLVPQDCAEFAKFLGIEVDLSKQQAARDEELDALVQAMKSRPRNPEIEAENLAEMRAAFGPGETVVNILTGETYKT